MSFTKDLFGRAIIPSTEGVKYAGSKTKLLPQILDFIGKSPLATVFDGFSGSTRVSQSLAQSGYRVSANDISEWSETFNHCYLGNKKEASSYDELIEHLNNVKPVDGWFSENYGGVVSNEEKGSAIQQNGLKKPWQIHNTRKLDAIRDEIDNLNLDKLTQSVALTSLILAMDKVDNTLGHYVSYLKDWSPRSYKELKLKVPNLWVNEKDHKVLKGDIFDILPKIEADLAYFDPPYGSNNEKMPPSRVRYASYYHVWTSIIRNDKPELFGKCNRRKDTSDIVATSVFEDFRKSDSGRFIVVEAIDRLIKETPCERIVLSYSSGGRATAEELNELLHDNGVVEAIAEIEHNKNVMAHMKWTNEWLRESDQPNKEYLFMLKKA